jgi:hypothetical protein
MFTDGGVYAADGSIFLMRAKIELLPAMHGVIAATGAVDFVRAVNLMIGKANPGTFSDLKDGLADFIRDGVDLGMRAGEVGVDTFELIVAAWDDQEDRPRLLKAAPAPNGIRVSESDLFRSPNLPPLQRPIYDADKPRESGVALLEAQRRAVCGLVAIPGSAAHVVGGVAHHTVVARDGVTTTIVRRWPDVVGEKIVPLGEVA